MRKLVPVCAEKSYSILNFLLQTSINVSDNSITIVFAMVVHNSNSIAIVLPAMSILSQWSDLAALVTPSNNPFQRGHAV